MVHRKHYEQNTHSTLADSICSFNFVLVCRYSFPNTNSLKRSDSSGEDLIDLPSDYNTYRTERKTR